MVVLHANKKSLWISHKTFLWKNDSRSDVDGFNSFIGTVFRKTFTLQPGALLALKTNVQGFENVTYVNNRILFRYYGFYIFKAFDDMPILDWEQLLTPLAVLGMTSFQWESAPLFSYCDRIENVPNRKARVGLALTLSPLGNSC